MLCCTVPSSQSTSVLGVLVRALVQEQPRTSARSDNGSELLLSGVWGPLEDARPWGHHQEACFGCLLRAEPAGLLEAIWEPVLLGSGPSRALSSSPRTGCPLTEVPEGEEVMKSPPRTQEPGVLPPETASHDLRSELIQLQSDCGSKAEPDFHVSGPAQTFSFTNINKS